MAVNCREFFVREESQEEAKGKNTAEPWLLLAGGQ
jgi:hypothetical protein